MITIKEITVGAGTGFNHPFEQFSNFKPSITIRATFEGDEQMVDDATRQLQRIAHVHVIAEKQRIIAELEVDNAIRQAETTVDRLKRFVDGIDREKPLIEERITKLRTRLVQANSSGTTPEFEVADLMIQITGGESRLHEFPADRDKALRKIQAFTAYIADLRAGRPATEPETDTDTHIF